MIKETSMEEFEQISEKEFLEHSETIARSRDGWTFVGVIKGSRQPHGISCIIEKDGQRETTRIFWMTGMMCRSNI